MITLLCDQWHLEDVCVYVFLCVCVYTCFCVCICVLMCVCVFVCENLMWRTLTVVTAGEFLPGLTFLSDAFLGGDHGARRPRALQRCGFSPALGQCRSVPCALETRPHRGLIPWAPVRKCCQQSLASSQRCYSEISRKAS